MDLFEDISFQLLFVAKISFIANLFLPDDETVRYYGREVLLFGFVDGPRFLIAVFESVGPKQSAVFLRAPEDVHSKAGKTTDY